MVLAIGAVALVVGAAILSPPPPSGQGGPCDYPVVPLQHYHAQLQIYDQGTLQPIPGDIGVNPDLTFDRSLIACTSGDPAHGAAPVHTHSGEPNVLHIESRVDRSYTLGDFFRAWGQPIGPEATWHFRADARHVITMEVNGAPSGDWGNLVLEGQMQIRIDYFQR